MPPFEQAPKHFNVELSPQRKGLADAIWFKARDCPPEKKLTAYSALMWAAKELHIADDKESTKPSEVLGDMFGYLTEKINEENRKKIKKEYVISNSQTSQAPTKPLRAPSHPPIKSGKDLAAGVDKDDDDPQGSLL